ncbi:aldo/keto reductase [Zhenpiania hominis]|uniref:Aldo/keto reductase n=1 Tax=Zhenpiania hominis TaxID=2763644 RepID=A0A923SSX0_9FIRM|nr:aldo/keto reductase [Zhenpiania hominis]MBC6680819.1 aldo/keto reductase [Zhenpiania hominis]
MQYRTFDKTGQKISLLGMGTMRLPVTEDGQVDREAAISMIRHSIDEGINYVDTAYMYHDGESEKIVGQALKDGYREKVLLADKMPVWLAKDEEAMRSIFDEQFARLEVDVIDMYLVHNVTVPVWKRAQKFHLMDFLEEKRAEGKIRHIGFSFHDQLSLFKEVIDSYPWDFCQIQLNYMDKEFQAGEEGLHYAAEKGIPVIIMEPLKGGKLTDTLPPSVKALWKQAEIQRTPAEWALRWVANHSEILTILSGMSAPEQLEENLRILSQAKPNSLTEKELSIIDQVSSEYNRLIQYSCTSCKYCMPCPKKIDIPTAIRFYNEWFLYEGNPKIKADYPNWLVKDRQPGDCIACKACEDHCPQHLPISEIMKKTAEIFE